MKHFKSLSAATAASVLALSMVATPVFAASGDDQTSFYIPTNVTVSESDKGITLPERVKFKFTPAYGTSITITSDQVRAVTQGVDNIEVIAVGEKDAGKKELEATVAYDEVKDTSGSLIGYKTKLDIQLNDDNISKPGLYYFEISESGHGIYDASGQQIKDGETDETVDGLTNDGQAAETAQKAVVAVVVTNNDDEESTNKYRIGQVLFYTVTTEDGTTKLDKKDPDPQEPGSTEPNTYSSYFTANYDTYSLTVKKSVTGSLGNKTKEFEIAINPTTTNTYTKELTYTGDDGQLAKAQNQSDATATFDLSKEVGATLPTTSLHDGESVIIHGLTANDLVAVKEKFGLKSGTTTNELDRQGYTDSYSITADTYTGTAISELAVDETNKNGTENGLKVSGFKSTTSTPEVTVTNNMDEVTITGVANTYGPFVLMAAVGAIFVGFFFRRRREE